MIFDTASMYFRAFHGLPSSLRSPQGEPVNAVRGLLDAMARLVVQYRPGALAAAWDDDWRPAWRVALVPSYKTHRVVGAEESGAPKSGALAATGGLAEESPEGLAHQVPVIREVLGALGVPVVGVADHEADDVIATLATLQPHSLVVTGDRDLFQLATGPTRVLYIGKGVARHDLVDDAWVQGRYGVRAARYVDFATLRGDPSDGLPGVKGVGDKSAATLVGTFGDLDGILAAAADPTSAMTATVRTRITAATDYLDAARRVVAVVRDLPLADVDLALRPERIDHARLAALDERWGLGSSLERIVAALEG